MAPCALHTEPDQEGSDEDVLHRVFAFFSDDADMPAGDAIRKPGICVQYQRRDWDITLQPRSPRRRQTERSQTGMAIAFDRERARATWSHGVQRVGDRVVYTAPLEHDTDRPEPNRRAVIHLTEHEVCERTLERYLVRVQEAHGVCQQTLCSIASRTKRTVRGIGFKEVVRARRPVIDQRVDDRVSKICERRTSRAPLLLLGRRSGGHETKPYGSTSGQINPRPAGRHESVCEDLRHATTRCKSLTHVEPRSFPEQTAKRRRKRRRNFVYN
jgi:hypothetical protein